MAVSMGGSRTEKNLAIAFGGESMARSRYTFFASKAKKQGYEQIAAFFLETAENEREHAKSFLKLMGGKGGPVRIQLDVLAYGVGDTLANLKFAADGELEEHSEIYPHMAAIAEEEGFTEVARVYRAVAEVERAHEKRFRILAKQVEANTVWKRDREVNWKCRNCGYVFVGNEAPAKCPACGHPQGWYEIQEVLE